MKTEERDHARSLRREEGRSIKEIAALVGVSPSSVSLWVRGIELTERQHEALRERKPAYNRQRSGNATMAARARARRTGYQDEGRALARRGEPFHAGGCMLFWAEGSRKRNIVSFSNSDPKMMRFFVGFLRTYFDVKDDEIRVWCNLFADHVARQRGIEQFWLDTLELPRTCLTKSTVNTYSRHSQQKRKNMLPYGTCRVTVHSTRIAQSLYGSIQEYARFDREEWLG